MQRPIEVQLPDDRNPAQEVLGAVRQRLIGERHLPLRDVAFESRVDRKVLARLFTAAGRLHDDDRYGAGDLAYAHDLAALLERFDVVLLERMLRLHQRSATTVAVNQLALLRSEPMLGPLLEAESEIPPTSVADVLGSFEDAVHAAVTAVGEVLVVKFIGDAVMLVSGSLDRLVDVLTRVVDAPLPDGEEVERRAGAGAGPVVIRDGDDVGTPVNIAARLTDLARPGSVLVAEDAVERLSDDWTSRQLRPRKLKGLGRSRPSRVWPVGAAR